MDCYFKFLIATTMNYNFIEFNSSIQFILDASNLASSKIVKNQNSTSILPVRTNCVPLLEKYTLMEIFKILLPYFKALCLKAKYALKTNGHSHEGRELFQV